MAGLVKPKKYDWKDSNLALFGSDLEKNVKRESAGTEKAWNNAGQHTGLQIWRIVKFKVTHWPRDDYGKFFDGDSYIILSTYKKPKTNELLYNLHYWIGRYSTQDEYGACAYKTVELDIFLGDKPVQHREVQQHESDLFKSYFKEMTIMKGGAETGFRHVGPEKYTPRLFHFRRQSRKAGGGVNVTIKEVPCFQESLDSDDVMVFDTGLKLFQWNGKQSNKDERFRALQYCKKIQGERSGGRVKLETLEEDRISPKSEFFVKLQTGGKKRAKKERDVVDAPTEKKLFKVSDSDGELKMTLVTSGTVTQDDFKSEDAFVLDKGDHVFVWVGSGTSEDEKKNALPLAHKYLQQCDHPLVPATVISEGQGDSKDFNEALD